VALISGADTALLFDTLKELGRMNFFPKYMSRAGLIYRSGLAFASLAGGYLYQFWIGLPYAMMGVFQFLAVGVIFLMIEPKIDTEKFSFRNYLKQARDGFKQLFQSNYMKKLTLFYTVIGGITWANLTFFNQPYIKSFGFTEKEMGWLFSGLYLGSSLLLLFFTENEQILTRNRVYLGFPILMMIAYLPGFWVGRAIAPFLILIAIFCGSGRFAILDKYTNKEFLSKYRATAISALNMLVGIFYIVLVSLGGKIQDNFGAKITFTFLGALTLLFVLPTGLSLVLEYKNYLKNRKL
jgi:Na+/melibiose symporter-like transporter